MTSFWQAQRQQLGQGTPDRMKGDSVQVLAVCGPMGAGSMAMKVAEVKYSEPTLFQPQGRSKNGIFLDLVLEKGGNPGVLNLCFC